MPARMFVVALVVVGSLAAAPAATAAERRCGKGPFRDYYDVRARVATCQAARDVVKAWGTNGCAVFQRCRARRYTCIGHRSDRLIAGRETFLITCRTSTRTVRWWIAPSY